jgi:hypothetical protein
MIEMKLNELVALKNRGIARKLFILHRGRKTTIYIGVNASNVREKEIFLLFRFISLMFKMKFQWKLALA